MATAAKTAAGVAQKSWIARKWKQGWMEIPIIMACHCITGPVFISAVIYAITESQSIAKTQKYRNAYTVVRPGDSRIERINHESSIDKYSIFG